MRGFDFHYLMALAPFLQIEDYLGDLDNIQWELDLNWSINQKFNLYFSIPAQAIIAALSPQRLISGKILSKLFLALP